MLGRRHTALEHSTRTLVMMAGTRKPTVNRLCVHNGFLLSFTDTHDMIRAAKVSIPPTHVPLKDHRTSTTTGQSTFWFAAPSDWNDLQKSLKLDSSIPMSTSNNTFLFFFKKSLLINNDQICHPNSNPAPEEKMSYFFASCGTKKHDDDGRSGGGAVGAL